MTRRERRSALDALASSRILVIDGAMGSLIQTYGLGEEDFRGARFAGHNRPLKGDNDLLCLTRPDVIRAIHDTYIEAGADIVTTNTFNSTFISQADYGLESVAREMNVAAARIAREACAAAEARDGAPRCCSGPRRSPTCRWPRSTSSPMTRRRGSPPGIRPPRRCPPRRTLDSCLSSSLVMAVARPSDRPR
jgi:hypothetical protein